MTQNPSEVLRGVKKQLELGASRARASAPETTVSGVSEVRAKRGPQADVGADGGPHSLVHIAMLSREGS